MNTAAECSVAVSDANYGTVSAPERDGTTAALITFFIALIVLLFAFLNRVPQSYPPSAKIIDPPDRNAYARFKLDGFDSPYLGHTGSWNGKGGTALAGSPIFKSNAIPYSIGPIADAVSFHVYEGLDSAFAGQPRTIEVVFDELREIFETSEKRSAKFPYSRKYEYWHTEGNFDFIGALSKELRAAWRIQFFTRAFAAGVRKVCVMDASEPEIRAVRAYTDALPWPFPMHRADEPIQAINPNSNAIAYRHLDGTEPEHGQVWILWLPAGQPDSTIKIPVHQNSVTIIKTDASKTTQPSNHGHVEVHLNGDQKMVAPVLVVDR